MKTSFTYLGKNSFDFGMRVEEGVTFESPERDYEFVEIKGLDGDIAVDNNRLKSVTKSFPVTIFPIPGKTFAEQITDISNWLKAKTGTTAIEVSNEPDYQYSGIYYEQYSLEKFLRQYGKVVLNFKIKPTKFLKTGLTEIALPATITNQTNRNARPKMVIKGTGNITINIGTSTLTLKNVDGGVIVDSLAQTITTLDGTRPAWDKMTSYPFPVIAPGKQTILKTGTITDVKIIPRFEVIV